ncbi:hypothetical protein BE08_46165 [Sorangium cellulosum]|uniref:Uncharacterized protein n=1 Tax=Sorangium cellulosum TaxID=56 RepID=A0A150P2X9_SORCE|nr:hypothetical protein BE08_46165 [Sorangium cellulosum]
MSGAAGCGSGAGDHAAGNLDDGGPRYAVAGRVNSGDFTSATSFVWVVDDVNEGSVGLGEAVELPGGASIWGVAQAEVFYVVSSEELTISKYGAAGGKPELKGRLGLNGAEISFLLGEKMLFDGPDRAFLFDLSSAQALEIDLAVMEITRHIDLSDALIESADYTLLGDPGFRKRGDRYVASVYGTSAKYDRMAGESKILFFDPADGSIEVKDAPCGGLNYTVEAANGDLYFASDPFVASLFLLDPERAPAPCMARMAAGKDEPDTAVVALNDVTGGATGGLIPGSDGVAYLRVLDTEIFSPGAGSTHLDVFSAPAWQTWRIDLSDPESAERLEHAPRAGGIKVFEVDGHAYENESTADFASTTLVRTTGDDAPARALTMPGVTWGVVRVR